jgi:SAM-dependent methyltransferase
MSVGEYFTTRENCRLCEAGPVQLVVPLAPLPVASPNVGNAATVEELAPADLMQCKHCGFLQLPAIVDPDFQYKNFKYVTGISIGLRQHFEALIQELKDQGEIDSGKLVFDIGSNDGSLLRYAQNLGARVLGIDPAQQIAADATADGIPTIADFFTTEKAEEIKSEHGTADLIIANNTLANIDDLSGIFDGVNELMSADGLFVIETQYALDVFEKLLLDVVYHEHISYFAVKPMMGFLAQKGFELVEARQISPKGGSIRFYIQKVGGTRPVGPSVASLISLEEESGMYDGSLFTTFNEEISKIGSELRARLQAERGAGKETKAYGASVGCAALIRYFDLGGLIDKIYDDQPLADSINTANRSVPIVPGAELDGAEPGDVLVLGWRYMASIATRRKKFLEKGGRFYRALPDLAYHDGVV